MNNKGYTLIEIVIVVVIIGIMVGLSSIGFSYFNKLSSDSNLESLATAFDTARYDSMSHSDSSIKLEIENDGHSYYARVLENSDVIEEYKLGNSKYTMLLNNDSDIYPIDDNDKMYITFKKSDGSFDSCKLNDEDISWGSVCYINSANSDSKLVLALETGRVLLQ